jgi:DNA (cytosine-5)-methyltransferase 1
MYKVTNKKPIAIDLFCGAGGLSSGLEAAGFEIAAAVDVDSKACLTYRQNHKKTIIISEDIAKLKTQDVLKRANLSKESIALIVGGPPCQGFSMANGKTRTKENPKNRLVKHFVRFVREIRPPLFLMENVLGFKSIAQGKVAQDLKARLSQLGYKTKLVTLDAASYGVPQHRLRVFLIGSRCGKEFQEPPPRYGISAKKPFVTVKEAIIGDLPNITPPGNDFSKYAGPPVTSYQSRIRGRADKLYNHIATRNGELVRKRKSLVPIGGNWKSVPKRFCDIKVQYSATYKRLNPNEPSITVSNFRKSMLIHPYQNRGLSVREAARLQSFPDSYIFYGGICSMQQQVGDAVPPLLAKAVGKQLKALLI